jgi:DNA (cytosine-5)-methyltransferase 1
MKPRHSDRVPKAIDLFAGCGGCTVGLKKAGFEVVGAVEINEAAKVVYELNHPEVRLWHKPIQDLTSNNILKELDLKVGELDLLAGCPPCQGFSTVRTLNGCRVVNDDRNNLIFDFERLVDGLRPKTVMLENVPGLVEDARLDRFVQSLSKLGYTVNYKVLDAAEYGVPQRRRRVILLAGHFGSIAFGRKARRRPTVRDAIHSLKSVGKSGDPIHDALERRTEKVMDLIRQIPKDGGSRSALPESFQLPCHRRCNGFKDIYGRMSWDLVAPTLTTGCHNPSRGRFLHPQEDRAITMREAALLQTFPKKYTFPANFGKTALADLIGNAIPPEFVRRHAGSVFRYLSTNGSRK